MKALGGHDVNFWTLLVSPRCFRRDRNRCGDGKCTSICQSLKKLKRPGDVETAGIRRIEQCNRTRLFVQKEGACDDHTMKYTNGGI